MRCRQVTFFATLNSNYKPRPSSHSLKPQTFAYSQMCCLVSISLLSFRLFIGDFNLPLRIFLPKPYTGSRCFPPSKSYLALHSLHFAAWDVKLPKHLINQSRTSSLRICGNTRTSAETLSIYFTYKKHFSLQFSNVLTPVCDHLAFSFYVEERVETFQKRYVTNLFAQPICQV